MTSMKSPLPRGGALSIAVKLVMLTLVVPRVLRYRLRARP